MGLLGDVKAKIEAVKAGQSLPINWSKRKGKVRYRLQGTITCETVEN